MEKISESDYNNAIQLIKNYKIQLQKEIDVIDEHTKNYNGLMNPNTFLSDKECTLSVKAKNLILIGIEVYELLGQYDRHEVKKLAQLKHLSLFTRNQLSEIKGLGTSTFYEIYKLMKLLDLKFIEFPDTEPRITDWMEVRDFSQRLYSTLLSINEDRHYNFTFRTYGTKNPFINDITKNFFLRQRHAGQKTWEEFVKKRGF